MGIKITLKTVFAPEEHQGRCAFFVIGPNGGIEFLRQETGSLKEHTAYHLQAIKFRQHAAVKDGACGEVAEAFDAAVLDAQTADDQAAMFVEIFGKMAVFGPFDLRGKLQ